VPPDKHLEALRHMLHNVGWIVPDILNALTADNPIFFDKVEQITMPIWSSNRVALLGDAAYCPTLISGQGASMAMAGAYFLAQALERCPSHHAAFQQYERRLRPFIESTQKKARDFAPNFVPSTPFRISLITLIMKFIDFPPLAHLIGSQMNTKSILEDEPQAVHA